MDPAATQVAYAQEIAVAAAETIRLQWQECQPLMNALGILSAN